MSVISKAIRPIYFSVTVPCNFLERDFGFCSLHKWNKFEKKKNFHKQFKQDITGGRKNNILRAKKVLQQTIIRANYPQHLYSWDESIPAFPMTVIQEIYCRQIVSNRARPCLQGDGWKSSIRLTRTLLSLPSQFWGKLVRFRVMMQVWWEVLPEAVCMHKSISNNLTTASHRLYLSYKQRNKSFGKSHQWLVSKVGRVGVRARYEILIDVKTGNRISIDARHHMLHRQTRIVHSKNNRPAKMHLLSHSEVSGLLHCLVPASRNFYSHVL